MPAPKVSDAEILESIREHNGNKTHAAQSLDINLRSLQRRINRMKENHPELREVSAPDGFAVKGVSTLYDMDGQVKAQWVKTQQDQQRKLELIEEAIQGLSDSIPRVKPSQPKGSHTGSLMACYPIGDHHFGMLAWEDETWEDYDLDIGERLLNGAISHLVDTTPKCEHATIIALGDFLHYDSMAPVTPTNNNPLASDSRLPKMIQTGIRSLRYAISACLKRHKHVRVIVEVGNHDLVSSIWLAACLAGVYENEPRVTVDQSPKHFHYFTHGKCLVGTHHGHGVKLQELPLLMATHVPKEWGESKYRYWWTGHVHHDQAKDYNGCKVESFRILPPADDYAANKGYMPGRDMKAIILHEEYGEVSRHIVNPEMLR